MHRDRALSLLSKIGHVVAVILEKKESVVHRCKLNVIQKTGEVVILSQLFSRYWDFVTESLVCYM